MVKKMVWLISLFLVLCNVSPAYMDTDVNRLAREFVIMLVKGDYETAVQKFDPTLKQALPVKTLTATWQSVLAQRGEFKAQVAVRKETVPTYTAVFVTVQFAKAVLDIKVVFNAKNEIAGLFFQPVPTDRAGKRQVLSAGVIEKNVSIKCQEWTLPATLALPAQTGQYPAVILVHGSGPQDRDETLGANKPFRDIAWGLAQKGIAVLRYDKRTFVYGERAFMNSVTVREEVIDDVGAAIALLNKTSGIKQDQIFVLGHSLGGMLIPKIALHAQTVKGLIVMAGPCRPLEDLILEQSVYLCGLDGSISAEEQSYLGLLKKQVAKVKSPELAKTTAPTELLLGAPASYWLDLRAYNPALTAQKVKQPLLILQGERDYQVTLVDFNMWREALTKQNEVDFKLYPGLNHLFIFGEGKPHPGEYEVPGQVDKKVIDDISIWVKRWAENTCI
jgi:dienelactone hydrolase